MEQNIRQNWNTIEDRGDKCVLFYGLNSLPRRGMCVVEEGIG